ncbi:MAG: hypothetical protein SFX73_40800 [Kofleriaceae bacterium]|nr:hypothetical protein [Kofleriaceae bacterium]
MRISCALLIALAACGDGGTAQDARVDVDASRTMVRVHVRVDDGVNAGGHRVFFQKADSELVLATLTDADGRANAFMASGGSVSVAFRDSTTLSTDVFTLQDVTADEDVVIDLRGYPQQPRAVYIQVPADGDAEDYELFSSCGSAFISDADLQPQIAELRDCTDVADLLVRSARGRFLFRPAVPIPQNIRVTFDGAWEPPVVSSIALVHVPASHRDVIVTQRVSGQSRSFYPLGLEGGNTGALEFLRLEEGAASGTFDQAVPMPAGSTLVTWVTPFQPTTPGGLFVVDWGPPQPATAIDVAPLSLRAYLTQPRYDPDTHRITWLEADQGVDTDGILVRFGWVEERGGTSVLWHVLGPRGMPASFALPALPDPDLRPPPTAEVEELMSIKLEGGFARLRALPLLGRWRPSSDRPWPLDAPSGRVVYQSISATL